MPRDPLDNIEVARVGLRPCVRCAGTLLLTVRIPHSLHGPEGQQISGYRTVSLCPRCNVNDPHAQGVLAYFTVHESIEPGSVPEVAAVVREWLEHVIATPPVYTDADLDAEAEEWLRENP